MNFIIENDETRKIVYQEVEKGFGGESVVLLETLLVKLKEQNFTTDEKLIASINQIESIVIDLSNNYIIPMKPHIYIPNFDGVVVNNKNLYQASEYNFETDEPELVVFDGNETEYLPSPSGSGYVESPITEWPSYVFNSDGELIESGYLIGEEYTIEHEVWVLAMNELDNICDGSGNPCLPDFTYADNSLPPNNTSVPDWEDAYFRTMQINDFKEAWPSGKSEINIVRFATWENGFNPLSGQSNFVNWVGDASWENIRKWLRSSEGKNVIINWTYFDNWNPPTEPNSDGSIGTHMWYVIYEHDWGASLKDVSVTSGLGHTLFLTYRSRQSPYIFGVIDYLESDGLTQSNSSIAFESLVKKD